MPAYKPYPTSKTERSRKNRKHARQSVYQANKSINSRRVKKEEATKV